MEWKEYLEKSFGTPSIEYYDKKLNEIKEQFLEMGQLKSDFDVEKFTVKKEGSFIAHNFHFLMRQYSLAMFEMRRMLIEREEKLRKLSDLQKKKEAGEERIDVLTEFGTDSKYTDLEIKKTMNEIDLQEVNMVNKIAMCDRFEKARLKIIELNGGTAPTNEQYQKEEPEYWKWFLERRAMWQTKQRLTGISEGIWENIDNLEEPALINPAFQVEMLEPSGMLNMMKIQVDIEKRKGFADRADLLMKSEELVKKIIKKGEPNGEAEDRKAE